MAISYRLFPCAPRFLAAPSCRAVVQRRRKRSEAGLRFKYSRCTPPCPHPRFTLTLPRAKRIDIVRGRGAPGPIAQRAPLRRVLDLRLPSGFPHPTGTRRCNQRRQPYPTLQKAPRATPRLPWLRPLPARPVLFRVPLAPLPTHLSRATSRFTPQSRCSLAKAAHVSHTHVSRIVIRPPSPYSHPQL